MMSDSRYRTVVKQEHVRHREIAVLVVTVVLGLVLLAGFFLGQKASYSGMGVDPATYSEMKVSLPLATQERQAIQETLDVLELQHELDSTALELVRKELASQKDTIGKLEEGLRFYRGLMAPEEIAQGLSLRKLELVTTAASNRFVFRLVAQQEALKHTTLQGSVSIEVFGSRGGEAVSYPLADLSDDIDDNTIPLRFRYFQAIEGELTVPEGFDPQGFRVVAKATAPRKVELREQFSWDVHKRFTYVGK